MEEIRLKATEKEIVSMIKSIFGKDVVTRTDNDLLLVEVDIENVLRSYVQAVVNVVRVKLGDKLFDIKEDGETLTIMIRDTVLAEPLYKRDVKPKEVCCGSCKYLEYEDITGNGVCREDGDLHGVGDCCSMYKPDIKTEEITSHDRNNR